jgi:hypothetical protein
MAGETVKIKTPQFWTEAEKQNWLKLIQFRRPKLTAKQLARIHKAAVELVYLGLEGSFEHGYESTIDAEIESMERSVECGQEAVAQQKVYPIGSVLNNRGEVVYSATVARRIIEECGNGRRLEEK